MSDFSQRINKTNSFQLCQENQRGHYIFHMPLLDCSQVDFMVSNSSPWRCRGGGSMAKVQRQAPALLIGKMILPRDYAAAVCVAVVLISTTSVHVEGRAIQGPDFTSCKRVTPKVLHYPGEGINGTIDCCMLTAGKTIKDFEFNLDLPMRVRRPAHKLDEEYIRKYERAMELMRALSPEDPRSHRAQANIHCAYCSDIYMQFNTTSTVQFDIHHSWLFLAFHRWYMYFHERILASLIGDDTFALPYWAWDVQSLEDNANVIPAAYVRKNSSLYDEFRSPVHQPPKRANLQLRGSDTVTGDDLVDQNSFIMWAMMIGDVKTPEAFYGERYADGDAKFIGDAIFESSAHASVHYWVGLDPFAGLDLSPAWSAARDPIFFAHHSQVDRLWWMWKNWGGKDLADTDWLDAQYVFYDENGDLVRVNVRDSLNFDNFRVTYEQVDPDWMDYQPKSIRDIDPKYVRAGILRRFLRRVVDGETYTNIVNALVGYFQPEKYGAKVSFGGVKRAMVTSRLSMPEVIKSSSDASSVYDEVLVIAGAVEKPFDVDVHFNIFLELPEADETTPRNCVEFLGTVTVDGSTDGMHPTVVKKFRRTIGIGERLQILNIVRQKWVTVTFVPAWDQKDDSDVLVRVTDLIVERKLL